MLVRTLVGKYPGCPPNCPSPSQCTISVRPRGTGFCDSAHDCFHGSHLDASGRTVCNDLGGCGCGAGGGHAELVLSLLCALAVRDALRKREGGAQKKAPPPVEVAP